jgi:hypothetical protein
MGTSVQHLRSYIVQLFYVWSEQESTVFVKRMDLKNLEDEYIFSTSALSIFAFTLAS